MGCSYDYKMISYIKLIIYINGMIILSKKFLTYAFEALKWGIFLF